MTLESTITKVSYKGNGVARVFPLPFRLARAEHAQVHLRQGEQRGVRLSSGYAVEDLDLQEPSLLYPFDAEAPALKNGDTITIMRVVPLTQQTDLENGGLMDAEVLEQQFDITTMQIQQLAEELARTPKFDPDADNTSLSIQDIYAEMTAALNRAEQAAQRAENVADGKTLVAGVNNLRGTWLGPAVPENGVLMLPVGYYPGRHVLSLSFGGVACYPWKEGQEKGLFQYEEMGNKEEISRQVRLLFAAEAGTVWDAHVLASNLSGIS